MRGCCPHRAKRDVVHIQGGAYTRRCTYKAVHTKGRLWPLQESHYLGACGGVPRIERREPYSTYKAVHTQGGTHTRRCTHKAVHTKGPLWPPQESCYVGGVWGCPPHGAKRAVVHIQGGAYTRRCTYKAVHTQGAAHKRPFVATARVLLCRRGAGLSPASSEGSRSPHTRWCMHKAVHIQGGAHTRRCTQKAACGHRMSLVVEGGCGGVARIERSET